MNFNQAISILQTLILGIVGGYIVKVIVKFYPTIKAFIVAKIGLTNFQKLTAIGWEVFYIVEEHYRLSSVICSKVELFGTLIRGKVPNITDAQIESIRQAVAGEYNKDKAEVTKVIEATPVIKYYDPLTGKELPAGVKPTMPA